jgi:hypothetical protein
MSAQDFFAKGCDAKGLGAYLDSLTSSARLAEVRTLSGKQQAALFEAAKADGRPIALSDFVPVSLPPLSEVIHEGKNSLALFSHFQKRFCRPEPGATELWGYNEQPMKWATGPGYFRARGIEDGQVLIDYLEVPPGKPQSWPQILPNSARLSRFVYFNTRDTMRGVSQHVSIGRAARDGKWMENWFVLCRQ